MVLPRVALPQAALFVALAALVAFATGCAAPYELTYPEPRLLGPAVVPTPHASAENAEGETGVPEVAALAEPATLEEALALVRHPAPRVAAEVRARYGEYRKSRNKTRAHGSPCQRRADPVKRPEYLSCPSTFRTFYLSNRSSMTMPMRTPSPDTTALGITDDLACETQCVDLGAVQTARTVLRDRNIEASAALLSALGDLTRLRLVTVLLQGPLCTCDLAVVLGVSDSAVSHQLRLLKDLQLVASRREGRIVYHELAGEHVRRFVTGARTHAQEVIAAS